MVREPGAAGREDPRRPKSTRTRLGEDVERPPPAFLCPHPVPGKRGPPTCHLGGSRSQAQSTAWAPERAGDRRAGAPGGCRNCSPGARSIGWGGRQRLAPTGWPAGIDNHPHPAQARAYTHTHTHARTHPQPQSASAAGKRDPGAPFGRRRDPAAAGSALRGYRLPAPRPRLYLRPPPPRVRLPPPPGWPQAAR